MSNEYSQWRGVIRGKWGQAPPSGGKKELQALLIKSWLIHWSISLCVKTFWMSMNYFLNLYIINHSLLCDGLGPIQPPASLTLPAAHSIGVQLGGWGRPLLSLLRAGTWEKSKCACSGFHSSQRHSRRWASRVVRYQILQHCYQCFLARSTPLVLEKIW